MKHKLKLQKDASANSCASANPHFDDIAMVAGVLSPVKEVLVDGALLAEAVGVVEWHGIRPPFTATVIPNRSVQVVPLSSRRLRR